MLVAVATASLRTISVAPARKANVPVAMTINHKPPAILAFKRGDACAIRSIIHNLPAAPPHERGKAEFSSFVRLTGRHLSRNKSAQYMYGETYENRDARVPKPGADRRTKFGDWNETNN